MASPYYNTVITGAVNATPGQITPISVPNSQAGDQVMNVVTLVGGIVGEDVTTSFLNTTIITVDGVTGLLQVSSNLSGLTLLALVQRG